MMVQLLFGNSTSNSEIFLLFFLFVLILSCEKEKCYTIEGKEIINGEYYLLFRTQESLIGQVITLVIMVCTQVYLIHMVQVKLTKKHMTLLL